MNSCSQYLLVTLLYVWLSKCNHTNGFVQVKELELNRCEGDAQDLLEGVHEKLNVLALGDSWLDRLVKKKIIILISKDSVGLKREQ
ncbi:hypothetical protein YC2023_066672 [Brassica napus]